MKKFVVTVGRLDMIESKVDLDRDYKCILDIDMLIPPGPVHRECDGASGCCTVPGPSLHQGPGDCVANYGEVENVTGGCRGLMMTLDLSFVRRLRSGCRVTNYYEFCQSRLQTRLRTSVGF